MKVYLAQLLCPNRHAIMGAARECETELDAKTLGGAVSYGFEQLCADGVLNPKCELCGSTDLRVEVMPTKFATMEEAKPHLMENQLAQMATREAILGRHSRN